MIFRTKNLRTLFLSAALGAGLASAVVTPTAMAQTSLGTLTGVVRDTSGAVVTNAEVTVTNAATGEARQVKTNELGSYRFDGLPGGAYTLHVESAGFQKYSAAGIKVAASVTQSYDPTLAVGSAGNETVEVVADTQVLLDKENGSLAGSIPQEELQKLPIFTLNPIEVLSTVPGVQIVSNSNMSNGTSIQVSGARPRSNNFMIDGEEINDASIGGQAVQPNIPDMYADTVIYTHNAPAEFGRASGGVVNLITKGGSNTFHGSAWELYSGSGLNAVDGQTRYQTKDRGAKARYDQHQYGFTAGGPVIKNKLFAFGAAQWSRYYGNEQASIVYLPDANGVALLKSLAAGSGTTASQAALLLKYLSNATYVNTFINGGAYKSVNLGAACPTTNSACADSGGLLSLGMFRRPNEPEKSPDTQWTYRIDYTPRSADTFTARYLHDRNSLTPDFFTNGSALPGFDTEQGGPSELGQGTWTHIFTPNLLNEFRVAETRLSYDFAPTSETTKNSLYTAANISTGDMTTLGFNQNFPQGRGQDMYQFQDTVSWTHGRHTLRIGADIGRRIEKDRVSLNFNGGVNFVKGGSGVSATGNYLLNQLGPAGTVTRTYGNNRLDPHSWRSGVFAQDDFKLNADLTINLGIRYDYFTSPENVLKYPGLDTRNPFADIQTVYKVNTDKNNLAPRIGFAYTPSAGPFADRKTVIRGGFGMFYDSDFTNIAVNEAQNAPNAAAGTLTASKSVAPNGLQNAMQLVSQVPNQVNPKSTVMSVDKRLVSPYSIEFNFGVERELPWHIGINATYVGTRGIKLFANQAYNYFDPNTGYRLNPSRGAINARANSASSTYHGLEVGVKRNFAKGLAVYGSYVYSKSLDDGSEVFTTDTAMTSYAADLTAGGRKHDWGNSAYDHRHYGSISYVWTPAGLRSDNHTADKFMSAVTRNWTLSGTSRFQSGAYASMNEYGFDSNGDGNTGNDRPFLGNPSRPNSAVGIDGYLVGGQSGTYYDVVQLNTTGNMVEVTPNDVHWLVAATNGYDKREIGRNNYALPGTLYNDMALEKAIPASFLRMEQGRFVIRAEAQNIANHNNVGGSNAYSYDVNVTDAGLDSYMNTQQSRESNGRTLRFWAKFVF